MKYSNTNYRQNIIAFWQQYFPNYKIPIGFHVHHIKPKSICKQEGWSDEQINHPRNLMVVHPVEHFSFHQLRGDRSANNNFIIGVVGSTPWMKGRKHTDDTKKKMSTSSKGQTPWNKGIPHSDETKKKIGAKSKNRIPNNETRLKMSESHKGIMYGPKSNETKAKLSKINTGLKFFNNGVKTIRVKPGNEPEGFTLGLLQKKV